MKTTFIKLFVAVLILAGVTLSASAKDETRSVSGFDAIASSGSFSVHVKIDGSETLSLSGPEDLLNQIETVVEHGTLKIKFKNEHWWSDNHNNERVDVYVTAKKLETLINSGSGSIKVEGTCTGGEIKVVLSGSGSISTAIKGEEVNATISGSGNINLDGSVRDASVAISGSGSLYGKNLHTSTCSVAISGSGNVSIEAEKQLSASLMGSGSVRYSGSASVSTTKMGSGSVRHVSED
jgi:hypothetical protein